MQIQTILILGILLVTTGLENGKASKNHLELLFDDISALARITNAIALQSSVIQKTFDTKTVLADIFRLNPANFSDITSHDTSKFNNSWNELSENYQQITKDTKPYVGKNGELIKMNENLYYAIDMDYDVEAAVINGFFEEMRRNDAGKTLLVCDQNLVQIILNFRNVMRNQSTLSGLLTVDQQKKALESMKSNIQNISDCMESIQNYQETVNPILEKGKIFGKIVMARDVFKIFKEANYSSYSTHLENFQKILGLKNFKKFKKPSLKIHEIIQTTIQLFQDLTDKNRASEQVLTVGFGNFSLLRQDIQSDWFKSKIAANKSTVILEKSLESFMGFGLLVEEMWTTFLNWNTVFRNEEERKWLEWIAEEWKGIYEIEDLKEEEQFLNRTNTLFNTCWKSNGQHNLNFSEFDQKIDNLIHLNTTVTDMMEWVDQTISSIDSEVLKVSLEQLGALNFENKNLKEVKQAILEIDTFKFLVDYCSKFEKLEELQDRFLSQFKALKPSKIDEILIETIQKLKNSTVTQDLKCLKSSGLDALRVEKLNFSISSIREISDQNLTKDIQRVVGYYESFRKSYMNLVDYVKKNMEGKGSGQEVLLKFKNSAKVAQAFGAGIQALAVIGKAFNKREELIQSTQYYFAVDAYIVGFNKDTNTRKFWGNDSKKVIMKMVKDMDKLNDFCGKIRRKEILEIREVFEKAGEVPGIKGYNEFFWHIADQLDMVKGFFTSSQTASNNSLKLESLELDFTSYKGDLDGAKLSVQEIKNYFDEIFGLKKEKAKEEKIVVNSYLVISISIPLFFLMLSCVLILHGRSENGKRMYKNLYLYYFGKPADFEKRWRYSLFLDRQDGQNALIDAVREANPQNVKQIVKKGAFINVYNEYGNTPLHMATKLGYPEIVEILIRHGADRTLLNSQNKTPEQMIGENIQSMISSTMKTSTTMKVSTKSSTKTSSTTEKSGKLEKIDKIKRIYKKYRNKKFRIRVPEVFPSSSFHIYADKSTDDQLTNKFMNEFQSIASTELLPTTTHIIVRTDPKGVLDLDSMQLLIWVLSGVIIVKESWMADCLKDPKLIEKDCQYLVEKVRYKGTVYPTVTQWAEAMAKGAMPYLYGVYVAVTVPEYQNFPALISIVSSLGGTVLDQFPEKWQYNIGSHPYLHAHLGPIFVIHDGKTNLNFYKNHPDKMYTLFTEDEFVGLLLRRQIKRDTRPHTIPVMVEGDD